MRVDVKVSEATRGKSMHCIKTLEGEIQKLGEDLKVSRETRDKWMHCIKALDGEIQQLREDLKVSEETKNKWMHTQFDNMIELVRGSRNSRPTLDVGTQIDLVELEMQESSA